MKEAVTSYEPVGTSILKAPFTSDTPPKSVPTTTILAPSSGYEFTSVTTPTSDCANNPVIIKTDVIRLRYFIIISLFVIV